MLILENKQNLPCGDMLTGEAFVSEIGILRI